MQFTHVLTMAGVLSAGLGPVRAQDPPPPPPPVQSAVPQTQTPVQAQQPPVQTQTPPSEAQPQTTPAPPPVPASEVTAAAPPALTAAEVRNRREAIFLFEGVLMNAVKLAAQNTAGEIRRVEPGIVLFSSEPVRAHGTYLQDYGVFFHVEIPSVIPSVASLVETLERNRPRPTTSPAQPTALTGSSEAMMDPDAHYVRSVTEQLINAMIRHSSSMDLRPHEWLTVEARDGSEAPGQLSQPSTMNLRVKGSDLADFAAGRISIEEVRKRVQVRGF